jgi:hypothetical protein
LKRKKNSRTPHRHTSTHAHSHTHAPYTGTHAMHTPMHSHTRHAHAHTPCTCTRKGTHFTHAHAQHYTPCTTRTAQKKKFEGKKGQSIQTIIFRSWSCYLCQTHLFGSKGKVQLHGGAANWCSSSYRVGLVEPEPSQTRPKALLSSVLGWEVSRAHARPEVILRLH